MTITLKELPVQVDAENLAKGFLGLMDEDERTVLRFGMLPGPKMELLERQLKEKFEKLGKPVSEVFANSGLLSLGETTSDDERISTVNGEIQEWSLKKLVSEATHEISLELYRQGDLVV